MKNSKEFSTGCSISFFLRTWEKWIYNTSLVHLVLSANEDAINSIRNFLPKRSFPPSLLFPQDKLSPILKLLSRPGFTIPPDVFSTKVQALLSNGLHDTNTQAIRRFLDCRGVHSSSISGPNNEQTWRRFRKRRSLRSGQANDRLSQMAQICMRCHWNHKNR